MSNLVDHAWDGWRVAPANSRSDLLEQWHQAVAQGILAPGSRLPNERLIAHWSGLSRSTVRAFLAELEHSGRIRRFVGRGTYVANEADLNSAEPVNIKHLTPAELLEFRLAIEPTLADLIVLKTTDEQLEQLAIVAQNGRGVRSWQQAEQSDRAFHKALFDATGNRAFAELGRQLSAARDSPSWQRLKEGSFSLKEWSLYQQDHEAIVRSLFTRNAESARAALRRHLGGVRMKWEL